MWTRLIATLLIGMLAFLSLACEREGPAERAGEQVDETMEKAGEQMEEAGERARQ